jgi:isoquinoline 1-oxidoreductase beta subunit
MHDGYERHFFDTCTFNEVVAIVGKSTWEVMDAKKALKVEWQPSPERTIKRNAFDRSETITIRLVLKALSVIQMD